MASLFGKMVKQGGTNSGGSPEHGNAAFNVSALQLRFPERGDDAPIRGLVVISSSIGGAENAA